MFGLGFLDFMVLASIGLLISAGAIFVNNLDKRKKEMERFRLMPTDQLQLEISRLERKIDKRETNHILHFLVSCFTISLWLIPWVLISMNNAEYRKQYEKLISVALDSRSNGVA